MPSKYYILFFGLIFSLNTYSQTTNDLVVVLHEETLNKLFQKIGIIKGEGEYEILKFKRKYQWYLRDTHIKLIPDSALFLTDALVDAGFNQYQDNVVGRLAVQYNPKTNQIALKLADAVFEIYATILGKKFVIKRVQLADYLKTPFMFEGPKSIEADMVFDLPDGTKKVLVAKPSKCEMQILPEKIIVSSEIDFFEKNSTLPKLDSQKKN
jgi:hypothetical protein